VQKAKQVECKYTIERYFINKECETIESRSFSENNTKYMYMSTQEEAIMF